MAEYFTTVLKSRQTHKNAKVFHRKFRNIFRTVIRLKLMDSYKYTKR
jgi:hypothetical protein